MEIYRMTDEPTSPEARTFHETAFDDCRAGSPVELTATLYESVTIRRVTGKQVDDSSAPALP